MWRVETVNECGVVESIEGCNSELYAMISKWIPDRIDFNVVRATADDAVHLRELITAVKNNDMLYLDVDQLEFILDWDAFTSYRKKM